MKTMFRQVNLLRDETGAATTDWVVLTAAVAGLGMIVLAVVRPGTGDLATRAGEQMLTQTVATTF